MRRPRLRAATSAVAKAFLVLAVTLLVVVGVAIVALETGWAKNQLRALIVRQANQYLTARLDIGRLGGSLFRGIELGDIRLSREGQTLVAIDEVALSYSPRELWQNGTIVRRIRLTRPRFLIARQPDGRWNMTALVKRETREEQRTGPGRPIHLQQIEIVDGTVTLADPLEFGAAHVPSRYEGLNVSCSFDYEPVRWELRFASASWRGAASELTVNGLHGTLGNGPGGWLFDNFFVETPRSTFTLAGRVHRSENPTRLDLDVHASRFAFQEWSGVLRGLRNIAVDATFDARLHGPLSQLGTEIRLSGTGGNVDGTLVLDTTVPGWHGAGTVSIARLNLARWLNKPEKPSDITGRVKFDLDLDLGRHFPRGRYAFDGPHAAFMGYAADKVTATGIITATEVRIAHASGAAYGADIVADSGSIGIDEPYPYRFAGAATGVDLRRVPKAVPVPHVDSTLAFAYDVTGRFSQPFIAGRARFAPSQFLEARIGPGTVGTIDTSVKPIVYAGEGDLDNVDIRRFGQELDVGWMRDPRYTGTVSGHFRVDAAGADLASLRLTGGGRISRAYLFSGRIHDADVTIDIAGGTLQSSFDGAFDGVDPEVALNDPRFPARLTGSGRVTTTVRDLLVRSPEIADYDIDATIALEHSVIRGVRADTGHFTGRLANGSLSIAHADIAGPDLEGRASGVMTFDAESRSDIQYDLDRVDFGALDTLTHWGARGGLATSGRAAGPWSALHVQGNATVTQLAATGVTALTTTLDYDATIPSGDVLGGQVRLDGSGEFITVGGQTFEQVSGHVAMDRDRVSFDVRVSQRPGRNGAFAGAASVHLDRREVDVTGLTITLGSAPWRLDARERPTQVTWNADGLAITPAVLVGGAGGDQRLGVSGTWRRDGRGELRVTANHVFLETLQGAFESPARYGGVVDADAIVRGTPSDPIVTGQITVSEGRVARFTYQRLAGRVDFVHDEFAVDLRLDQSPGVWLTANGTFPLSLVDRNLPERPINVAIQSSDIGLGLIEGVTDVVRNVTGQLRIDVKAIGTSRDPHFDGAVDIANAGFVVASTGSTYKNGRAAVRVSTERITVDNLHLEDAGGRPLDVHGSLGTHELKVGDVEIDGTASQFEVMHNEFGRLTVDANLQLRGRFETPHIGGEISIDGSTLNVDEILRRTLFQPYATEPLSTPGVDAVAALNPWNRLSLDVILHVPNTLRVTGENVQVSPGTPIGLGNINLRVGGDLYVYKDEGRPPYINGSLDSMSGTYSFQGRRFDIDETGSSINFRGDLNPEVFVSVTREISGVLARVTIYGTLNNPELRLASTPPLDESDILSLIVFNTTPNQLSAAQQQELAVRAGTLAAGFLATPLVSAVENELGLDVLEIEAGSDVGGVFNPSPKVTIGQEIAPGLVARFSRQFGPEPYDEVTVEYYLSRLFRLRATFSDAASLNARSPFRRLERAGIDLLLFFSF